MKVFGRKLGQGEIFGIALMFVVIVIGILIYSQIKALSPDREVDADKKMKNELLAQSSLETILKTTTKCNVDGGAGFDTIQDLINTCLARSFGSSDVYVSCPDLSSSEIPLCSETIKMLEGSLDGLFNGSGALIKNTPYFLEIDLPNDAVSPLNSVNITNFGEFVYRGEVITKDNYRKFDFKKASSDLKPWATAQRSVKMTLAIYYQ